MRAQLSLEYLIIALIGLTLISISILALNKIRSNADSAYESVKFKAIKDDLFNAVDEICALGNGNSKAINVKHITIQSGSRSDTFFLSISSGKNSAAHESHCEIGINGQFDSEIVIANDGGKIINK